MSNLAEKINADIKKAMIEKRSEDLSTLRMLLSALKNKKIELGNKEELKDEEIVVVIKSEVKKRKDSIASYQSGGRVDLAEKEQREIDLLSAYLPEEMSEEELEKIVAAVIARVPDADQSKFGQIMGMAMKEVGGQADGVAVSAKVKKLLSK